MPMNDTGGLDPNDPNAPVAEVPDQGAEAPPTGDPSGDVNLVPIPLTDEKITEWWQEVEEARTARSRVEEKWDLLFKEYLPNITPGAEDLKAGIHFRNVHTKKAKLFFRTPDLVLTPEGKLPPMMDPATGIPYDIADVISIKQAVLKKHLGLKNVNAKRMVSECLFDVLAWAGLGCSKIGYRNVIQMVDEPVMQPDPTYVPPPPAPGSMLGLSPGPPPPQVPVIDPATGQPKVQKTPVTIYEEWYWVRFSPKKLLLPTSLTSGRIDQCSPWIGMEVFLPDTVVRSIYKLPDNYELKTTSDADDRIYKHDSSTGVRPKNLVRLVELWYKASIYDATVKHPQAIRQLVLIDGVKDKVLVHRPSPDQTFDEYGKLTPDSMIGFPIHLFANRELADTPWVWADNAFTNNAVKHINTHRKQSVKLRDVNIGKYLYDSGAFTPEEVTRLQRGEVGEWIAVQDGRLAQGSDKILAPVIKNEPARDDYRTASTLKQDVEETLGIGGTNAGATADTVRTATEISTSATALAERLDEERDKILEDYLIGVEKFDCLLQRYATEEDYVTWVGEDGARKISMYNSSVIGGCKWSYSAKPDSQLKLDVARDRAQTMEFIERMAPFQAIMNIKPLLKKAALQFGVDPSEVFLPSPPMGTPMPPGSGGGPPTGALPNQPAPGAGTPEMQRKKELGPSGPGGPK